MIVILDSAPLGLASHPRSRPGRDCNLWIESVIRAGGRVLIPEIADYEIRRELIRAGKTRGLRRLDDLVRGLEYLPITTAAMRRAAEFWAQARQGGQPTAADTALDADVILAAQADTLGLPDTIIATSNVRHLERFHRAANWSDITHDFVATR